MHARAIADFVFVFFDKFLSLLFFDTCFGLHYIRVVVLTRV